ncbi:hypothetical protein [Campylobacter taeniopygiae]|uniref:Lipoprotein n=1 Tax=Campylobacter taeniopygiae TaxID=2510188 RepID=A0ABY2THE5_9BACT|nr:hypothetical protein [Campylobacter taeniopygiae]TKX33252.1 hypothetical protein CQA75_08470 [Campylobacter taeniopygiae]
MKYIILTFIVGLIVFVSVKGCFYPTSYRAFIPKSLDSEYKEFEKFSQQELGRVLYARPLTEIEKNNLNKDSFYTITSRYGIKSKDMDMFVGIEFIYSEERLVYVYIKELGYYGGWNKWTFNLFILPNTTQRIYNSIKSVTINNSQIIQNKEIIGKLKIGDELDGSYAYVYLNIIVLKNLLDKPSYLNHFEENYDYFEDL